MNELQILLISAGVALIAIVLIYNGWQDWRARRSMGQTIDDDRHDVLMQQNETRREPGLVSNIAEENAEIDPLCEAVIDIALTNPVDGLTLQEPLSSIVSVGKKPVRTFATTAEGNHHTRMRPDANYTSIQLAILMANRSGPLTNIEWSHLWTLAQNLSDRFEGIIEAPDQNIVIKKAVELDALCADMDAQVGLILQLKEAKTNKEICASLNQSGFELRNGVWVWLADSSKPRFTVLFDANSTDPIHRVDLLLDVPNSVPDDKAFSHMVSVGRDLANHLDAHVLDDQGRTFQDSSASAIDKQLNDLYDKLDNAGFLAGTARTARVFS